MSKDEEKLKKEKERERARIEKEKELNRKQADLERLRKRLLQPAVVERNRPLREAYRAWRNQLLELIEFLDSRGLDIVTIEKLIYPLILTREIEIRDIKEQILSEESEGE